MIYPKNIESKIGFDEIRNRISENCISPMGKEYVDKIKFSDKFKYLNELLNQTFEFKNLLSFETGFPAKNFFDLRTILKRLKTEGTFITLEDLHSLNISLQQPAKIQQFFNEERIEKYPEIVKLLKLYEFDKSILNRIHLVIDEKGRIRENASEDLRTIKRKIISLNSGIRNRAEVFMQRAVSKGWCRDDAEMSIRNNRLVLPLHHTHKRKIQGFIHDESASGQTVYVEPAELFETNNQIRELQIEEVKEIKRILLELSDFLRPHINDLLSVYNFLGVLDFIRAKALFAIELDAYKPRLTNEPKINWNKAYHPLLLLSYKEKNKEVIPQDLKLNRNKNMLIISGPNAGGKSVALKTIALNQYMLQCGVLIPLKSTSEAGLFSEIFIDIGDEQSLEDDLSTYSSHLKNINFFSNNLTDKSLILIDEFGSGTEPDLGGAISEAALEYFYKNNSFVVITTHYANLKEFANNHERAVNAAMVYNTDKLEPTFRMKTGKPGSSFAFEIARKIGLRNELLQYATNIAGKDRIDFDRRLQELEIEKEKLKAQNKQLSSADDMLSDTIEKYNRLYEKLDDERNQIIKDAKKQAKDILNDSNKVIEKAIKEIKEANADKEKTKKIRKKLETDKKNIQRKKQKDIDFKEVKTENVQRAKPKRNKNNRALRKGDYVKIDNQSGTGQIDEISGKTAVVSFNSMKFKIDIKKLSLSEKSKTKRPSKKSSYTDIYQEKSGNFSNNLDIRGKRADEAVSIVLDWFDDAVMLGEYDLQILHGKGNGILRQMIRDALSKNKDISSLRDAPVDRGGAGITIVERRK